MIPAKVKVGIYEYDVKIQKDVKLGKQKCDGVISYFKQSIAIDESLPQINKEVTLWHEMIHLVSHQYNITLSEREVDCLAHGIVGILKDNFLNFQSNNGQISETLDDYLRTKQAGKK